MIRQFKRINATDTQLNRIQDNVGTSFDDLTNIPILGGNLITTTLLSASDTLVAHRLGRPAFGYFIAKCSSPGASVFDSTTVNNLPNQYLILRATANVTVTLWIF